ncbi:hypothetical protein [Streptomyces sp. NPDC096153]|uniref:hypothetical protein n=1 Tax=Streptomyces sp. NPDC096153 TaxID=3155548 RepID=UPI00331CF4BF
MDTALVTAIAALLASPVAAAAAIYGTRGQARAAREGNLLTGYDSFTNKLIAERDKAEAEASALALENARLRLLVTQLGGTP